MPTKPVVLFDPSELDQPTSKTQVIFDPSEVSSPATPPTPPVSAPAATAPAAPVVDSPRQPTGNAFADALQQWTDINIMGRLPVLGLQSIGQGVFQIAEGLGGAASAVGGTIERSKGAGDSNRWLGQKLREVGDAVSRFAEPYTKAPERIAHKAGKSFIENPSLLVDPEYITNLMGSGVGSMLGFLAMPQATVPQALQTTTKVAKVLGPLVKNLPAALTESIVDAGGAYNEAIEAGATPDKAADAFITVMLEETPVTMLTNQTGVFSDSLTGVKKVAASTASEATQEFVQGVAQKDAKNRALGTDESIVAGGEVDALGGGLTGGAVATVQAILGRKARLKRGAPEEQEQQAAAAPPAPEQTADPFANLSDEDLGLLAKSKKREFRQGARAEQRRRKAAAPVVLDPAEVSPVEPLAAPAGAQPVDAVQVDAVVDEPTGEVTPTEQAQSAPVEQPVPVHTPEPTAADPLDAPDHPAVVKWRDAMVAWGGMKPSKKKREAREAAGEIGRSFVGPFLEERAASLPEPAEDLQVVDDSYYAGDEESVNAPELYRATREEQLGRHAVAELYRQALILDGWPDKLRKEIEKDLDEVNASYHNAFIEVENAFGSEVADRMRQEIEGDKFVPRETQQEGVANDNETELPDADEAVAEAAPEEGQVEIGSKPAGGQPLGPVPQGPPAGEPAASSPAPVPSPQSPQPADIEEKQPVTPQVTDAPEGTKYVLPSFVTHQYQKPDKPAVEPKPKKKKLTEAEREQKKNAKHPMRQLWSTPPESTSTAPVAEMPHNVIADATPTAGAAESDPGSQPDGARDPRALAEVPSQDVQPDDASGTAESGVRSAGADPGSDVRPGDPAEDASGSGEGDGVSAVVSSPERDRPAGTRIRPADTPRAASRDYRIADPAQIGVGGPKEKARKNTEAIRLMKQLESEGRSATAEEQAVLASYTGWGALANAFDYYNRDWKGVNEELRQALTPEEFESARATTPNAHYTSPMVISAMWRAMDRLGIPRDASILEPSMGVGHFFGLIPAERTGRRTGIEIDSLTARIAKQLYPDSDVRHSPFEKTSIPNNFYDLAIGNVPFGNYGVHDPAYKKAPGFVTNAIHNYFFAKALDKVRPGGVVAFITSSYTLDGRTHRNFREYIAERADLIGAIRLPNTTFKGNAGTEVTTDIIFLQKREPQTPAQGETWAALGEVAGKDGKQYPVNEYYVRHPEMMLGTMEPGKMYSDSQMLGGELTEELLDSAIARLPEKVVKPWEGNTTQATQRPLAELPDAGTIKNHAYGVKDGKVIIRRDDSYEDANLSAAAAERVKGIIGVRDSLREVYRTQLDGESEEKVVAARKKLNSVYDAFVKKHGYLSAPPNYKAFLGDPDHPLVLSLENWNEETETATKAAIFEKRTLERYTPVEKTDTAAEALTVSLNEMGRLDWARMQELTGKTPDEMREELGTLVYKDPEGAWETADEYLSGNVRAKLAIAEAAAAADPAFERNVEALKAVQPADLTPEQIEVRLGASWVPAETVGQWLQELVKSRVKVSYLAPIAQWKVTVANEAVVGNTTTWGTKYFNADQLVEMALNGKIPVAYDYDSDGKRSQNKPETVVAQEKLAELQSNFSQWAWADPDRATALARKYNDEFNNIRLRVNDGSHLTFPGMARLTLRGGDLDKHQKNAVWRILRGGNTLLAHVVGAGKTFEMVAAAMEMRRIGLAKKPMFVVPNHLVGQTGAEFLRLYPNANLFIADQEHFAAGKRELAMARIANGNYDAVIVAHSSFEKIPVSVETHNAWINEQIRELEAAMAEMVRDKEDKKSIKELEKAKKRLEAKLRSKTDQTEKDQAVEFEQLGVDALFVDEAHLFKNLFFVTKRTRVAGIPATESARAMDMFLKTQYITRINNGRGVVFATGTPVSNSMVEMYTMQRYLQMDYLRAVGMAHFDNWANNFGQAVTALELAPDGSGYRMHTRFAKFANLPELLTGFRQMADVQTAEMLNLPRPKLKGGGPRSVAAPSTPALKAFVQDLVKRAEKVRSGKVDPSSDNMLKITSHGRWAALDMRMVDPAAPDNPDSKLNQAIEKIHRIWKDTAGNKSAQLVFLDFSLSLKGKKPGQGALTNFSAYDDLKAKLIAKGVPAKEIAFIHDTKNDAEKTKLFAAVNAGKVRILVGSTPKMGAGTNVQKKLIALHHLDAPWRPSDIEQREGRILRQGNSNPEVEIYRYVTEESFDAYMWQTLETKAKFIGQVMTGDTSVRSAEDIDGAALTYAEMKAIASGNPAVLEKHKVDNEVRKLDALQAAHQRQQRDIAFGIPAAKARIEDLKQSVKRYEDDIARRDAGEKVFVIGKKKFEGDDARKNAAAALQKILENTKDDRQPFPIGSYHGFDLETKYRTPEIINGDSFARLPFIQIKGTGWTYTATPNEDNPLGTIQSIEAQVRNLENGRDGMQTGLEAEQTKLKDLQEQAGKPFPHAEKLKDLLAKQKQLNDSLDLGKNDNQAAAAADDAPPAAPSLGGLLKDESGTFDPAALGKALKPAADFVRPVGSRIRSEGRAATSLMDLVEKAHDKGEVTAGKRVVELVDAGLDKLSREEAFNLVDVLEGRRQPVNQKVRTAADAARSVLDAQADDAIDLGVMVRVNRFLYPNEPIPQELKLNAFQAAARNNGKRVRVSYLKPFEAHDNYYPHVLPGPERLKRGAIRKDVADNLVRRRIAANKSEAERLIDAYVRFSESGKREQSLIDYIVRSNQASNEADAFELLTKMRNMSRAKQHRNLEYERTINLPFWDPDPRRVLPTIIASGAIRLSEIEHLGGQKHEKVKALVNQVRKQGGNADFVKAKVNEILGLIDEPDTGLEKLSSTLRMLQGFKLGLAAIPNVTQGALNTLLHGDFRAVLAGVKGVATKKGRRFGIESGAALEATLLESMRQAGAPGDALRLFLEASGFTATERANRIFAANAGASYAKRMLARARLNDQRAKRMLAELGIDVAAAMRNGLTPDDLLMAAKKFSDITQFRARPQDLPAFASTPMGKVAFQFKAYIYGQTRLLHRALIDEVRQGSPGRAFRNLAVLAIAFPLTGAVIDAIRDAIKGDEDDDKNALKQYLDGIAATGALGVFNDLFEAGNYRRVAGYIAGPTASDLADLAQIRSMEGLEKFAFRHIPLLGQIGYKRVFPSKQGGGTMDPELKKLMGADDDIVNQVLKATGTE
jgi:N12 class adenine-specific DNA methylase